MTSIKEWRFESKAGGDRYVRQWPNDRASWIALLSHGYGEHIARFDHVADTLRAAGACVAGPDHLGHGRSGGEPVLIKDFEVIIDDLQEVAERMQEQMPGVPMVLIGHSMGGMIAARYAQRHGRRLAALVLSGPMFGTREILAQLLELDPIPDIPLDPAVLSRDPSVGRNYAEDPLVWHGPFKRQTLEAMLAAMDTIGSGPSFGDLPALWMHGANDMLVPLDATAPMMEHLRGKLFEKKIYPGAMHEIFNEINRREVIDDMIGFIGRFVG